MSHSSETTLQANAYAWHADEAYSSLGDLCETIRTADATQARLLPAQLLSYLAKTLSNVEIDIYVEECLPMVCDAAHAYLRAMGTFSARHSDPAAVDAARERLIQSLEILDDEIRLCRPMAVAS